MVRSAAPLRDSIDRSMAPDSIGRSMEYSHATSPATGEQPSAGEGPAAGTAGRGEESPAGTVKSTAGTPGFGARGRMRRRARFLRKARELAYRDLGGLVYSLHRFGQRNDALVLAKLETIGRIDNELRGLESALAERQPVTVLREAGVAACPRCAAIHGSDDRFCPNCGLAMDPRAERPVAGAAAPAPVQPPVTPAGPPAQSGPPSAPLFAAQPPVVPTSSSSPEPRVTPVLAKPAVPTSSSSPEPRATPVPATPVPATPAGTSETAAAAKGARETAGTSVDESTEIIRPPIESS
jgi:hypothetical protein